jgi:hypothetical protein
MPFTVVDPGVPDEHDCMDPVGDMPFVWNFPQGAVIECDTCGQRWYHGKFHFWEKTDWKGDK